MSASMVSSDKIVDVKSSDDQKDEEPDPPRNFTQQQLAYFDGTKDTSTKLKEGQTAPDKPVYLSVNGIVFDVSEGRNFYGPDGPYEKFAGHECGVALAKMSFDDQLLDDLEGCSNLNFGERTELEGWIDKFTNYRCYPIKGRLIPDSQMPDKDRIIGAEELAKYNGTKDVECPEGYASAPIYIGAGDKVFDVSFGGGSFYGEGGPYNKFAGKDATRALAKMSLDDEDLQTADVSDLTEKQIKTLNDWIKTFGERKQYPVVGRLDKKK